MEEQKNALDTQIDGSHYKDQLLQPIELAYILGGTPAFCKLAKYLTREKGDKKINLQKARHCILLEKDLHCFCEQYTQRGSDGIPDYWITKFTKNSYIRLALLNMCQGNYSGAINQVEEYAKSLGIPLDE